MTGKMCTVKNRGVGVVSYRIPDENIKRIFAPGETKTIAYDELVKLKFQAGGQEMMENFLQIQDAEAIEDLDLKTEDEYNMSEKDVIELLKNGTQDEFLDVLDFAPQGVIDLIKTFAVQLPLESVPKREALLKKTGLNVTEALRLNENTEEAEPTPAPERRVQKAERRTASKYKVVNIKE